ncbi:MAG: hypothetical protein CEO19_148 [Parcubacteria group bacterium Gr01-1014_73]|nr:MAG: hypothetical protein CEO19_148 [Parcubacteria group bacterium Gr01-1014_73]
MKTYTFASGTVSPGFVLTDDQERGKVLNLGEYAPGSFLRRIPLNNNPDNCPEVDGNVVSDAFLLNVGQEKDFFILSRDRSQGNNGYCCLVRFLTVGNGGKGHGYVNRIAGWRSKELADGHGRNNGLVPENGIWTDSIWVVHEGELVKVQLAGCQQAFAVRVRDGEPTVEPWVNREPRQRSKSKPEVKPVVAVAGNGKGQNPHQWRKLQGAHVVTEIPPSVSIPIKKWTPGLNDSPEPKIDLDKELLAGLGKDRLAKWNARYQQPVVA